MKNKKMLWDNVNNDIANMEFEDMKNPIYDGIILYIEEADPMEDIVSEIWDSLDGPDDYSPRYMCDGVYIEKNGRTYID